MNINGKTMIFRNDYEGKAYYKTSIQNTMYEGKDQYMSVDVQIPKDKSINNMTVIDVTKGFLSFYKTKEGLPKVKMIVQEYTETEKKESTPDFEVSMSDDLPF